MRFGFFGNNNNYPFLLAEELREQGHDVVLFVNKRGLLDRPESRDPARFAGGYPEWIVDASELSEWECIALAPSLAPVLDRLAECDALVLNDVGVSFQPLLGRPTIVFLTGADLDYYASLQMPALRVQAGSAEYRGSAAARCDQQVLTGFVERQRQGLRAAVAVNWALPGLFPRSEALLAEIGVTPAQVFNLQMADLRRIAPTPPPAGRVPRLFCGTRLTWKLPIEPGRSAMDYKGSDVMLRGIAEHARRGGGAVELRLVRKGLHVAETVALAAELGIAEQVTWLDEMPLAALWQEFAGCDVAFEQLGGSVVSMVALDVMAAGRPVIGNARPDVPTVFTGADSPICQAATPDEVAEWLRRLLTDPAERRRRGEAGRAFVERHFSPARAARLCLERLRDGAGAGSRHGHLLQQLADLRGELRAVAGGGALAAAGGADRERALLAALRAVHRGGRKALLWQVLPGPFAAEGPRGWTAPLPQLTDRADDAGAPRRSPLLLLEDDRLLGPAHADHGELRHKGAGRYSHWLTHLYFSTSDGSDPNRNGRAYTVVLARD